MDKFIYLFGYYFDCIGATVLDFQWIFWTILALWLVPKLSVLYARYLVKMFKKI